MSSKLNPFALPETQVFWDGAAEKKFLIQQCESCGHNYFPPAPVCPKCSSREVVHREASGKATLYSYVISSTPWPQWGVEEPMSVALVDLEEGPRILSTIINCPQTRDALVIDMPLQLTFKKFGEDGPNMACFQPADRTREKAR